MLQVFYRTSKFLNDSPFRPYEALKNSCFLSQCVNNFFKLKTLQHVLNNNFKNLIWQTNTQKANKEVITNKTKPVTKLSSLAWRWCLFAAVRKNWKTSVHKFKSKSRDFRWNWIETNLSYFVLNNYIFSI